MKKNGWNYHEMDIPITMYIKGDTIIDEKAYKKVYEIDLRINKSGTPEFASAIREEGRKIYVKRKNWPEERLMIDGDAISQLGRNVSLLNHVGRYEDCYKVARLSTIHSQGIDYRAVVLDDTTSSYYYNVWIDGIGYYTRGIRMVFAKGWDGGDYDYVFDSCYDGDVCIFRKEDVIGNSIRPPKERQ